MRVSFDFDPITCKVTNVTCEGVEQAPSKRSPSKKKETSDKVQLKGSSLKLNEEVLSLLGLKVGDRVCIQYTNDAPVLVNPATAGMEGGGNLITKSNSVVCRGKTAETLAKYGDEFSYTLQKEGFLLLKTQDSTAEKQVEQEIHTLDTSEIMPEGEEIDLDLDFN